MLKGVHRFKGQNSLQTSPNLLELRKAVGVPEHQPVLCPVTHGDEEP